MTLTERDAAPDSEARSLPECSFKLPWQGSCFGPTAPTASLVVLCVQGHPCRSNSSENPFRERNREETNPANRKGTGQRRNGEVAEWGTPPWSSSTLGGFMRSGKPYGTLGVKQVVLPAQRGGGDIPCWLFGLCRRSHRKSALTGGRW